MEALGILKILVFIFILGATLYSVMTYHDQQKSTQKNLASFRQQATAQRKLDATERQLLDTVITQANGITSDDVYLLSGPHMRYGLEGNGNTTWHETIAGVEVLLPYDANLYLQADNDALVVLTAEKAIVIALNDGFDLAGAAERKRHRQDEQDQWDNGEYGKLSRASAEDDKPLTIRDQRLESSAEIEARRGRGIALLPAFLWAVMFSMLGMATGVESPLALTFCLLTSLAAALLALYNFFVTRPEGEPQKVNLVAGKICLTPMAVDEYGHTETSVTLNKSIGFELPEHWHPLVDYEDGQHAEMAIRVDDFSVVNYDNRLSLDKEIRRFPPVYWGRHLTLAIVATIALLFPLGSFTQMSRDVLFFSQWLRGIDTLYLKNPETVQNQPLLPGTPVSIEGNGHCDLDVSDRHPMFNCRQIHWGANAPQSSHIVTSDITRRLQGKALLETQQDSYLTLMAIAQGWDSFHRGKPVMLTNLLDMVITLDTACVSGHILLEVAQQCRRIHRLILDHVAFTLDTKPSSWSEVSKQVQARKNSDRPVNAVTGKRLVTKLEYHFRKLANALNANRSDDIAQDIARSQQGGVLIRLVQGSVPTTLQDSTSYDGTTLLDKLLAMIDQPEGKPFHLEGMVTAYRHVNGASAELSLDLTRSSNTANLTVINLIWLLVAAALLAGHGVMAVIRYRQSNDRAKAIAAMYA